MCGTARSSYSTVTSVPRCATSADASCGSSADRASDHTPCAGSRKPPSAGTGPTRRAPTYSTAASTTDARSGFAEITGALLRPRSGCALRRHPDEGPRRLLTRRERARHAVDLVTERLDVAIHGAQIAIAHLPGVPPRHRWLAVAAVAGLQGLHPAVFA